MKAMTGSLMAGGLAMAMVLATPALAQRYPERPVRLVVPSAPGGSLDITGRRVGQLLSPLLGQPVLVDNVAGAGNALGTGEVARSKPDGYTLLLGASSGVVISPVVMKNANYDGVKDLTAISLIGLQYLVISVGPGMPANNFKDMIAMARANPGKFSYATPGVGSVNHLGGEVVNALAKTSIVHIPYKGAAPAMNDVMGGRVEIAPMTSASVTSLVKGGKVRILVSMSEERLAAFPDVPTAIESGFPGMVMSTFSGLFAQAATPRPIVNQLHGLTAKLLGNPEFQKELEGLGLILPPKRTPEETQRYIADFSARIVPIIKAAGIKED
jgi:tripartite-type tricarboxylate transporter receptor subunit TctC